MCEVTNGKIYVADMDLTCYKIVRKVTASHALSRETAKKIFVPVSMRMPMLYVMGKEYHTNDFERECIDTDRICRPSWVLRKFGGMWWEKIVAWIPEMDSSNPPKVFSRFSGTAFPIYTENDLKFTKKGFYSYTYFMNGRMSTDFRWQTSIEGYANIAVIRCIIPKGSRYLVSDSDECFVSENIVICDEVDMSSIKTAL